MSYVELPHGTVHYQDSGPSFRDSSGGDSSGDDSSFRDSGASNSSGGDSGASNSSGGDSGGGDSSGGDSSGGDSGPADSAARTPIVFLHGFLMGGNLWEPVVRLLDGEFRCVVPELPFGAHPVAMRPDADLTPDGLGRLVADFLDSLELSDVIVVGNDSGAAVAQVVAARYGERLGGLVLATGDAFDNFPPKPFRPLIAAARAGALTPVLSVIKSRRARSLPTAYGWLTHGELPHDLIDQWAKAYFGNSGVRRDLRRLTVALGDDEFMNQIATELTGFTKPTLLAWATDDKFFPVEHARRLAAILPDARVELIPDSRTWVMLDQPERTASLIAELARRVATRQAA